MQLAIEAASDEPGIALAVDGVVASSAMWVTDRNHSVELLPAIERLLGEAGRSKADVTAIFIDTGPGGYAGLRVSVSIAKALAHGLSVPIVGIGRLELDAYGVIADAGARRVVAVHRAGRGDTAWATYREDGGWREEIAPSMTKPDALLDALRADDLIVGDIDDEISDAAQRVGATAAPMEAHRVVALAALGHARLSAGRTDDARSLVPLYLRGPAIGPQRRASS